MALLKALDDRPLVLNGAGDRLADDRAAIPPEQAGELGRHLSR